MKKILVLLLMISCADPAVAPGVPDKIIPSTVRAATLQAISEMFPDHLNIKQNFPALFDPNTEKRVVLLKESEVYVTFVSESASFNNSFGYYTYNVNSIPTDVSQLDMHILFPTVDESKLKQGDMLQIGSSKFPAGTVIGFFLIIKGWEGESINYTKDKFYTDIGLNEGGSQQHILFKLSDFGDIILGFEDILESDPGYHDFDYNEIILTLTDNRQNKEATAFNLDHVIKL